MTTFRELLKEELKDESLKKSYYRGLEKARIAMEIEQYREDAGLTQKQLAYLIGTSQSAISRIENPDYGKYSMNTLRKIAEKLELELVLTFRKIDDEEYEKEPTIIYEVASWRANPQSHYNLVIKPAPQRVAEKC